MNDKERLIILIATLRSMARHDDAKSASARAVVAWAKDLLTLIEVPIEPGK